MDFLYMESKNDKFLEEENNLKSNIKQIEDHIEYKKNKKNRLEDECENYRGDKENVQYFVECYNKSKLLNDEIIFLEKKQIVHILAI